MQQVSLRRFATLAWFLLGLPAWAQVAPGGSGPGGYPRAAQQPMFAAGAPSGGVAVQESASEGGGVSTVNSSVQVSGNFAGSVAANDLPPGPVTLTIASAVKRALTVNLAAITYDNSTDLARSERMQALSALLPNISANASETVTQVNLAAYGFTFQVPANFGISIPTVVGPYAYSQLQGALSQSVFNLVDRRNWRASKESERASVFSGRDTRELIVMAVAGSYLQTVAMAARLDSQRAQVDNAKAVYDQAVVRKSAGTNARIDVTRSLVELQTQQQRLASLEADFRKQKIALARVIGVPLDRELILSEHIGYSETPVPEAQLTIQSALQHRWDLQAMATQVHGAEITLSAAHAERLPSATINGNYGVIGLNPAHTHGVFAVTGTVSVPLYEGGRIKADILQAETTLKQRRAELSDAQGRVESEVRSALIELETAAGQVHLARTNRQYAQETLVQARDRFHAGVANTVEVVQAQEQVASAESDYISSLFSFNVARLSLSRATGQAEAELPALLTSNHE